MIAFTAPTTLVTMAFWIVYMASSGRRIEAFLATSQAPHTNERSVKERSSSFEPLDAMKRPLLDRIASTLFQLETTRVEESSVLDDQGRMGEPMEWSQSSSFANKFSEMIASNSLGYSLKQGVADIVAGDFDEDAVSEKIDSFVATNSVAMFSFSTCPFCRRAKDILDEKGVEYQTMELDELDRNEGNEIRAMLGRKTKRTSVPAIFIGSKYIGGCNDGPGLLPLNESGELDELLKLC
jgi:glutaredoxin 3